MHGPMNIKKVISCWNVRFDS